MSRACAVHLSWKSFVQETQTRVRNGFKLLRAHDQIFYVSQVKKRTLQIAAYTGLLKTLSHPCGFWISRSMDTTRSKSEITNNMDASTQTACCGTNCCYPEKTEQEAIPKCYQDQIDKIFSELAEIKINSKQPFVCGALLETVLKNQQTIMENQKKIMDVIGWQS